MTEIPPNDNEESPAEMLLRELACWLGNGGYNAPHVDVEVFREKIVSGVQDWVRSAVDAEREHCAIVAESTQFTGNTFPITQLEQMRIDIVAAIRRGVTLV